MQRSIGILALGLFVLPLTSVTAAESNTSTAPKNDGATIQFTFGPASDPAQIPLCMIGASITWAEEGDWWRKHLLARIPRLAFIGTHTAKFGYSHAGEGGNSAEVVLKRVPALPDCPYYFLHIGTNSNNIKDAAQLPARSQKTADIIVQIVRALLEKPSAKKVFLCSILPCATDNPLRDKTNSATNVLLRKALGTDALPADKVAWVELEQPVRQLKDWEKLIRLHPSPDGYKEIAAIVADFLTKEFKLADPEKAPVAVPGAAVRVQNLWDEAAGQSAAPVIAGWYVLSFEWTAAEGAPSVVLSSPEGPKPFRMEFKPAANGRVEFPFFTGYEGYGYTRSALSLTAQGGAVSKVLLEKARPSGKASDYGTGVYLDAKSPLSIGELFEKP